jgi:NTP pyrophosphatase (non-canonical NTP hydrolase)
MRSFEKHFAKMVAREKKPMNYEELSALVLQWGEDKGIFAKSTPLRQLDKTQEELDETKEALQKLASLTDQQILSEKLLTDDPDTLDLEEDALAEAKDGIGDMLVTIILLAKMLNMDSVDCLQSAYDVIKKRTGKMVNGQFVKDN